MGFFVIVNTMNHMNKRLLILSIITAFSTMLYFYSQQKEILELKFAKDILSFSVIFYCIWTIAGVIFNELQFNSKEIAVLTTFFVMNFLWYAAGEWSALLFLSLPVQFFGIVSLKVFMRFVESYTLGGVHMVEENGSEVEKQIIL